MLSHVGVSMKHVVACPRPMPAVPNVMCSSVHFTSYTLSAGTFMNLSLFLSLSLC